MFSTHYKKYLLDFKGMNITFPIVHCFISWEQKDVKPYFISWFSAFRNREAITVLHGKVLNPQTILLKNNSSYNQTLSQNHQEKSLKTENPWLSWRAFCNKSIEKWPSLMTDAHLLRTKRAKY